MTVCSTSDLKEKTRWKKSNTGCCWCKFSEFELLESSDSVQHNKGGQGDPGRHPDSPKKCVASSVAHQSVLIAIHISLGLDWWYAFSASVLVETGLGNLSSRNFWLFNPSRSSRTSIHQDVLDRYSRALACSRNFALSRMLYAEMIAELLLLAKRLRLDAVCGADCGAAAAAFQKLHFSLFTLIFSLLCVM